MKPKPSPSLPKQRAKRAKARVMWGIIESVCHDEKITLSQEGEWPYEDIAVAVIPVRTQQQARQLVRWHNKTYAQKVGELAELLYLEAGGMKMLPTWSATNKTYYRAMVKTKYPYARSILNLLGESPDPEN